MLSRFSWYVTDFKKILLTKQHNKQKLTERHATQIIPVASRREDNESGNDDREGQLGETSTHDDNEDVVEEDSCNREVKEIQKKAISRYPAGCRTYMSRRLKHQGPSSQAFQKRLNENGCSNIRLNQKPLKNKKSNTNRE